MTALKMRRLSLPFADPISRALSRPFRRASAIDADPALTEAAVTAVNSAANNDSSPPLPTSTGPLGRRTSAFSRLTSPTRTNFTPAALVAPSSTRPNDADLPLRTQDNLYAYQVHLDTPLILSQMAFYTTNIVWELKDSERIYKILQKKSIITSAGEIKTSAITKHFAHQFAFLSAFAQRRVIGVLFWWEEEVQRLKGLLEQEREIKQVLDAGDVVDGGMRVLLGTELRRVRMLVQTKPSERLENGGGRGEELPAYEE